MRQVWTLARREFRSYFDQPTAYILVVAFLVLGLFLTFRSLLASGAASLRPFFDTLPWLFAIFIPAITMRSVAEERSAGTLEWLMAQPLNELELAVGKFLGDWLFTLVALAGTLPLALGLLAVSDADPGIMLAQYVGASLFAATFVAVGLFASSATRNQITAFILAVAISMALILAGLRFTLIGLPPALAGPVGRLSVITHFGSIARGVIDLRDVLYFLLTAALFLGLAYFLLARERLSPRRGAYRRLRLGVAAVAGSAIVLNLLGGDIHGRIDLTDDDLYTLADGTRQIVGGLDDVVTIKLFASSELPPEVQLTLRDLRDLLSDYRRASNGMVRVEELHPEEDEEAADEARSLGIRQIQFNVMRGDEFEIKNGWLGIAILHAGEQEVLPVVTRTDDLEYRLTSAIASMTAESKPTVAFLTGFGARGAMAYPSLREQLARRYTVSSIALDGDSVPALSPDSAGVVVFAAPTQPVSDSARRAIDAYLDAGGAGLFLVERHAVGGRMPIAQSVSPGLDSLFARRGLRVSPELAYDLRSNERVSLGQSGLFSYIAAYPLWPVGVPAGDHVVTRGLDAISLGWASPLEITDSTAVHPLWTTTEFGGTRPARSPISPQMQMQPDPASLAPRLLAAAVQADAAAAEGADGDAAPRAGGRLVVIGDGDFLQQQFVQANPQNLAFAANAIDWLAQDEALIAIRSKDRTPPPLVFDSDVQHAGLKWANLIGVPLLFVLLGAVRVVRRRGRSRLRWAETVAPETAAPETAAPETAA